MKSIDPSRAGGALLILGPVLTLLIMAMHPTGHDLVEDFDRMAIVNAMVHGTAIVAVPLIFLGLLALSRRLRHAVEAVAGCVAYGLAAIAWIVAAIASGFVQTEIYRRLPDAADPALLELLGSYTWWLNQSFAAIGVSASSLAIVAFSLALLRERRLLLAILGLVTGLGALFVHAFGLIDLDITGFGAIVLAQSAWLVGAGLFLLRDGGPAGPDASAVAGA